MSALIFQANQYTDSTSYPTVAVGYLRLQDAADNLLPVRVAAAVLASDRVVVTVGAERLHGLEVDRDRPKAGRVAPF